METKHFGQVLATILEDEKRIKLSFTPRGKGELDPGHPARCLSWALAALQPYTDLGYVFQGPEVGSEIILVGAENE